MLATNETEKEPFVHTDSLQSISNWTYFEKHEISDKKNGRY